MNKQPSSDEITWPDLADKFRQVEATTYQYSQSRSKFVLNEQSRVALIRRTLCSPERRLALDVAQHLKLEERLQLLPDLVLLASVSNAQIQTVRSIIASLPREQVLARIDEIAEPILQDGSDEEYRRLLELYSILDHNLMVKLAKKAIASEDDLIREAGKDFITK